MYATFESIKVKMVIIIKQHYLEKSWWNVLIWFTGHCNRAAVLRNFFFFFRYTILLQDVEDYVLLHAWVFTKIFT
jgi:hypothetical protein